MLILMTASLAVMLTVLGWVVFTALGKAAQNYQRQFQTNTQMQLSDAFIFLDPVHVWTISVSLSASLVLLLITVTGSWIITVLTGVISLAAPRLIIRFLRHKRTHNFDKQLPDFLQALSGALRSGAGIQNAFSLLAQELPAPISQELTLITRKQRIGMPFAQCLDELEARMPTEACRLMVSTIKIGARNGGSIADAVEEIALLVKERLQLQGRIKALTSQGKMQAWVMSLLPLCLLLVLNHLDPDSMQYMWYSTVGWIVLASIFVLEFLGLLMLRKIVNIDV